MLSSSTPANDNINAVQAIANVVKSSLGPVGLDKVISVPNCVLIEAAVGRSRNE